MHANIQLPPLYSISMTMQEEIDIFLLIQQYSLCQCSSRKEAG